MSVFSLLVDAGRARYIKGRGKCGSGMLVPIDRRDGGDSYEVRTDTGRSPRGTGRPRADSTAAAALMTAAQ
jgi:hypothetical protein